VSKQGDWIVRARSKPVPVGEAAQSALAGPSTAWQDPQYTMTS
jgi:hypothetical protein